MKYDIYYMVCRHTFSLYAKLTYKHSEEEDEDMKRI